MRCRVATLCLFAGGLLTFLPPTTAQAQPESYPVHPDAKVQEGVPQGRVLKRSWNESQVFPGTRREYFLYVPAQYDPSTPAAVMVFQDGQKYVRPNSSWALPNVFDNLIHRGDMPVTIAVCINPGVVPGDAEDDSQAQNRFNRSLEYDSMSDRYATFLIDEILPEVEKEFRLTNDPNLRGIGGSSSGAIAAFAAAWHRPDYFRRVFSTVGTFVGLRGGNEFPTLIRKTEPKPLKVFLQDGSHDLNIYGGDWWNANRTILSAFQWAGYDVEHRWGEGGHNGKHGSAIFADAMKWLWKDAGKPIRVSIQDHPELGHRMVSGKAWKRISSGHQNLSGVAVNADGDVYFSDIGKQEIWKISGDQAVKVHDQIEDARALAFHHQGDLLAATPSQSRIVRIDPQGGLHPLIEGVQADDLLETPQGLYFVCSQEQTIGMAPWNRDGSLGDPVYFTGPKRPCALSLTPDRRFLLVADAGGRHVWSFHLDATGMLEHGQPYSYLHIPQDNIASGVSSLTMTAVGELLAATKMGIQIFDQPGRVHAILKRPHRQGILKAIALGGDDQSKIYAALGRAVFVRPTQMRGWESWQQPVVPPKPRL